MKVINKCGTSINFDVAVTLMDEQLKEEIHNEIAPCTEQSFFNEYERRHEKKYGEEWELAKENPCY